MMVGKTHFTYKTFYMDLWVGQKIYPEKDNNTCGAGIQYHYKVILYISKGGQFRSQVINKILFNLKSNLK